MLSKIHLKRFTAFEDLEVEFSPGINIIIGENATGKTHLLKTAYSACKASNPGENFAEKLLVNFLPHENLLGRLINRSTYQAKAEVNVFRKDIKLSLSFSTKSKKITGDKDWTVTPLKSTYIPPKDMLANAPGFRALYSKREIYFEEFFVDILDQAFLPALRGPLDKNRSRLLGILQEVIEGNVTTTNEEFFLRFKDKPGNLEFSLLAEGFRKLGLLWKLIQNGSLIDGSILFWDEPEVNLNPKMLGTLARILIELQRDGTQIFIATHDYITMREFDLNCGNNDQIMYHALYRDESTGEIKCNSTDKFSRISPNAILDAFSDVYDREIRMASGAE